MCDRFRRLVSSFLPGGVSDCRRPGGDGTAKLRGIWKEGFGFALANKWYHHGGKTATQCRCALGLTVAKCFDVPALNAEGVGACGTGSLPASLRASSKTKEPLLKNALHQPSSAEGPDPEVKPVFTSSAWLMHSKIIHFVALMMAAMV